MKKLLLVAVAVAIVVGGGAFYGGMKYAQARRGNFANLTDDQRQQFMANAGGGFRNGTGGQRGGMMGGFISGEIISKDDKSITIKMRDGGSKIVFYSDSTKVEKFIDGATSDLEIGKNVSANGTANQDGSITAATVQIRPIMPTINQ